MWLPFLVGDMIHIASNNRKKPRKKFFICDRTRCGDGCSYDCRHTTDLKYALYPDHDDWFMAEDGSFWQRVRKK